MANDLNKSADRLLSRIVDDARCAADETAKAAQAEIDKIKESADKEAEAVRADFSARMEKAEADTLERSRTNAELDSRKYALQAKREIVEKAFEAAYDGLCALGGGERDALLSAMALREAVGGETLIPAKADADNMKRLLGEINAALSAKGMAALSLGEVTESIGGGFLLQGAGYEKNCSFNALLREVRECEESQVVKILFG